MNKELKVLAAICQDRTAYSIVSSQYEQGDFSDLGDLIFNEIREYYKRDAKVECVDVPSIRHRLVQKYAKHADKFNKVLRDLPDVSTPNVMSDYREVKRTAIGELLGSYLMAGDWEKAAPLQARFNELDQAKETVGKDAPVVYQDAEAADFCESLDIKNRIPIAPIALNEPMGGGLVAGCHVLIYAPPECGKTAMAINVAYSIATKGKTVMYFGNEESADMYLNRMLCRFTRWNLTRVLKDKPAAMILARKRGWKNLIFVHMSPGTIPQVQALILEHSPDVVIVDQLSNLILASGGKEPEKTQLLEKLAYAMRIFYSRNKIAGISMSQADEKAIGKLRLTIKDVYYSNIGVQGMCDVMIGIGMNDAYQAQGRRMLTLTKNKLGGVHDSVIVQLLNEISMLKGI